MTQQKLNKLQKKKQKNISPPSSANQHCTALAFGIWNKITVGRIFMIKLYLFDMGVDNGERLYQEVINIILKSWEKN